MSSMICHRCGHEWRGSEQCPKCKQWCIFPAKASPFVSSKKNEDDEEEEEDKPVFLRNSVTLADVEVTEEDRYQIGPIGVCWGGGVVKHGVSMVSGSPGAGKSTLTFPIVRSILQQSDGKVLFLATEENQKAIKQRADRLKISKKDQRRIKVYENPLDSEEILSQLEDLQPDAVIFDSVSMYASSDKERLLALKVLKAYANTGAPVIVTSHITKEENFAGRIELQHYVDVTLTLYPEGYDAAKRGVARKHMSDDVPRILTTEKSRHGPLCQLRIKMTETGFVPLPTVVED